MEEALTNELVVERIASFLPHADLKSARGVNSLWNKECNVFFRQRSIVAIGPGPTFFGCHWATRGDPSSKVTYEQVTFDELDMPNEELIARVPFKIKISSCELIHIYQGLVSNAAWIPRIGVLNLEGLALATEQLNRVLPFLLHRLPGLHTFDSGVSTLRQVSHEYGLESLYIPMVPADAVFSLTALRLKFSNSAGGVAAVPLRTGFLKNCKLLQSFEAQVTGSSSSFVKFLNSCRTCLPSKRLDHVSIRLPTWLPDGAQEFCEAVCHFINTTQPKSLELLGFEFLDFTTRRTTQGQNRVMEANLWTSVASSVLEPSSRLTSLTTSFPTDEYEEGGNSDEVHGYPELVLADLKKCAAFSKLTELSLEIFTGCKDGWITCNRSTNVAAHSLENLKSLRIVDKYFKNTAEGIGTGFKSFQHWHHEFPNVTRLTLGDFKIYCGLDDFEGVLRGLALMKALQELTLEIAEIDVEQRVIQLIDKSTRVNSGYLGELGKLTGLKKLYIKVEVLKMPKMLILALFAGYEPHVEVEIQLNQQLANGKRQEIRLQYNVDQLKETLKAVESYWADPWIV